MSGYDYRPFLPSPEASKIAGPTARAHAEARLKSPRAQGLFANWERLFSEPFVGITTAGTAIPDIYKVQPEGAPTRAMIVSSVAPPMSCWMLVRTVTRARILSSTPFLATAERVDLPLPRSEIGRAHV